MNEEKTVEFGHLKKGDVIKVIRKIEHDVFEKGAIYEAKIMHNDESYNRLEIEGYRYTILPDSAGDSFLTFFSLAEQSEDEQFRNELLCNH